MTGKLVILPLRLWLHSARLLTRAAERAASVAWRPIKAVTPGPHAADPGVQHAEPAEPRVHHAEPGVHHAEPGVQHGQPGVQHAEPGVRHGQPGVPQIDARDGQQPAAATPPRLAPPRPQPPRPEPPRPEQVAPTPPAPAPAPIIEEDVHVSEDPELVRELAEPGAEDGAGAAITVVEPWSGYRNMNAREVIERARRGSRAELAAVRLYESRHRSRQTVLAAVDRQLKLGNGTEPA